MGIAKMAEHEGSRDNLARCSETCGLPEGHGGMHEDEPRGPWPLELQLVPHPDMARGALALVRFRHIDDPANPDVAGEVTVTWFEEPES